MGNVSKNYQTPKGFRDFLPDEARVREAIISTLKEEFALFGFAPLETPAIEYAKTLLNKYGEEADRLIYLFTDRGGRKVGLRYDLTVPLSRVIAEYRDKLPIPFKRYQISPVWRAEKPQKGRFREFWQADFDNVGTTSFLADAEIIALSLKAAKRLGLNPVIEINDRKVFKDIPAKAISSIDKIEKVGKEKVLAEMQKKGISKEKGKKLLEKLKRIKKPISYTKIKEYLTSFGFKEDKDFVFNPFLARGLDYYTSVIFELKDKDYKAGSIGGGGRYDKLIGQFSGRNLPAVGFSFGIDRLIEALREGDKLIEEKGASSAEVLVTIFSAETFAYSIEVAAGLREAGITAEVYPDEEKKLEKQLKYADKKGINFAVIIGPEEVKKKKATLKDLETGKQESVPLTKLAGKIIG